MTAPVPPPITTASDHKPPGANSGRRMGRKRGGDRDQHADHAEQIAAAAGVGMRKPAQRQDEEDACDQIGQCGEVGAHDYFCFR